MSSFREDSYLTTGLTGMHVARHPTKTLANTYAKILRTTAKMPDDAAYRKYTEALVRDRAAIVEKAGNDWKMVEKEMNSGQIEELIIQADKELSLARQMLAWKPWEPLVTKPEADQWKWPPPK
ncbi:NADH dehydrogenase [ubiquinone] 1 alpha subcomplex subunit 5 [Frankliniella fusca]|uniref:NADH dehydrogenase [ubiquinone] 1 alpha subcomplex subunit 5 n=1 Tax=Frankliniella fusca TaxID=407009 RepID=A0AAE1H3L9_9NEOP|nr:NADH dehydrogenase [ubiquinone] 1 alpha subcomplex subunit 5 [Frankliniella fusca]